MKGDTIDDLRCALVGRRVLAIKPAVYPPDAEYDREIIAEYPRLSLDDGSEIVILTDMGFPPIVEVEKPSYVDEPLLWEGD